MSWVKLTLEEQMAIAKSNDIMERLHFSAYPVLPEVADYMVESTNRSDYLDYICTNLFRTCNNQVWASTLEKAAKKIIAFNNPKFYSGLTHIALHLNSTGDTLRYVFENNPCRGLEDVMVNWGLASNPNTPKVVLELLADADNLEILWTLLANPNTSDETRSKVKEKLSTDGEGFFPGYHYTLQGIEVTASGN